MSAITYTAARNIADATKAEQSIGGLWAKAYAAAALDMEQDGASLRDLAAAVTKAGTKCSKDTAGDYVLAHSLTVHGEAYESALSDRIGEGKVMRAHSLIAKARKARGIAYVRASLAALRQFDEVSEPDADALAKALAKVVRELDAAKPEAKAPEAPEADESTTGEESGEESSEAIKSDATADDYLMALAGPTVALRQALADGDAFDAGRMDAWLREVAAIANTVKARKATAAAA